MHTWYNETDEYRSLSSKPIAQIYRKENGRNIWQRYEDKAYVHITAKVGNLKRNRKVREGNREPEQGNDCHQRDDLYLKKWLNKGDEYFLYVTVTVIPISQMRERRWCDVIYKVEVIETNNPKPSWSQMWVYNHHVWSMKRLIASFSIKKYMFRPPYICWRLRRFK